MQIVHPAYARHLQQVTHHLAHVNVAGGAFQQDVDRFAQNAPGAPQGQQADKRAHQRVKTIHAGQRDDNARYNGALVAMTSPSKCMNALRRLSSLSLPRSTSQAVPAFTSSATTPTPMSTFASTCSGELIRRKAS